MDTIKAARKAKYKLPALRVTNGQPKDRINWGLDTEDDGKGNVLQINFFDGDKHYHFTDKDSAINWLMFGAKIPRKGVTIWATNLEYDLCNVFLGGNFHLIEAGYGGKSGFIVWAKLQGRKITFGDTLNLARMSVARMGTILGLEKGKLDPTDKDYCQRDTEITQRYVESFQDRVLGLGASMKLTAPAVALDLFRRKYLRYDVYRPKPTRIEYLLQAYYGGRSEIFQMEASGAIQYVDFNSLYPSVMAFNAYPNPNFLEKRIPELTEAGIIEATVETKSEFPSLPYRDKGKLLFPNGTYRGVWATIELKEAIEKDKSKILKIHSGLTYPALDDPFSEYVKTLYALRPRDGSIDDTVYKLLMNSLYGKFAQQNQITQLVPIRKAKGDITGRRVFDGMVFDDREISYPPHSNIIWSVWTTALGRIALSRLIQKVIDAGGTPIYCDTDSLIYSGQPLAELGQGLGELGEVGVFTAGKFLLPKVYMLEGEGGIEYVAKGIPKELASEFISLGFALWDAPVRLKEGLRQNTQPNVWRKVQKSLKTRYDKRIVKANGTTKPLTVREH